LKRTVLSFLAVPVRLLADRRSGSNPHERRVAVADFWLGTGAGRPSRSGRRYASRRYDDPLHFVTSCFPWGQPGTAPWFVCTTNRLYYRDAKETWFCSPATCKEENSEAFAGQHAADASSFYIFDEASAVPDKIFEVAEGGQSDGHLFIFLFGNPTRSSGKLYRVCFGSEQEGWVHKSIDSRDCILPNKELIAEWIATYGEVSDFIRVRVRGLPPVADELQFIDRSRI
jgi:hypothetical protein